MAAVVHHGGDGTAGAALEAGVPSVVVPSAYDQHFWAARLEELGVAGPPLRARGLRPAALAAAIRATGELGVRRRAARLRPALLAEEGVRRAVAIIEGG